MSADSAAQAPSKSRPGERVSWIYAAPAMVWVLLFMVAPLGLMVVYSFWTYSNYKISPAFTLDNYRVFFASATYVGVLTRTLLIAAFTTVFTIVLAYPVAFFLYRSSRAAAAVMIVLVTIPFWLNQLVRNYAFYGVLGKAGFINATLVALGFETAEIMFTVQAVVAVAVYVFLPYAVVILYASFERLSPSLLEASHDLGANTWQAFRRVLLPLTASGLQSAGMLIFILSLGMYLTPAMIGGGRTQMMATLLMPLVEQTLNYARGAAFSVILLAIVLFVVAAMSRLVDLEGIYRSGTGKSTARRGEMAGGKALLPFIATVIVFLYVPIVLVIVFSFDKNVASGFPLKGFTLDWYWDVFQNQIMLKSLRTSLMIALMAALLSIAIAVPAAFAVVRFRFPGRQILRLLILIPIVVPEFLLAVALLFLLSWAGIPLSTLTVAIGHATYTLPFVFFVALAHQYAFDRTIEWAAEDLGANRWQTFWKITVPLMASMVLSAAILSFTLSLNDFILNFMLTGTTPTLPVFMWSLLQTTMSPEINAVSGLLILGTVLLLLVPATTAVLAAKRAAARR